MSAPIFTACEVCGKRVFVTWFSPWGGDGRCKCGQCAKPPRADVQRTFPDHDAGDEDRTHYAAEPMPAAEFLKRAKARVG